MRAPLLIDGFLTIIIIFESSTTLCDLPLFAVAIRLHLAAPIEQRLVQNALRFRLLQVHLVLGADAQLLVLELLELFAVKCVCIRSRSS